jgi:O-acetyl-ADP-ribose deacetylase
MMSDTGNTGQSDKSGQSASSAGSNSGGETRTIRVVVGDLLDQHVDVIVNPWNRNIIPYWLLIPSGVSGAIKRKAGLEPFRELAENGPIPLGGAVLTGPGRLRTVKGIIHVAGINMFWRASEQSVRDSVVNAMKIVNQLNFQSVAFPLIGSGAGGMNESRAYEILRDTLVATPTQADVRIVRRHRDS